MSTYAIARSLPRASARGGGWQTAGGLLVAALAAGLTVFLASRSAISAAALLIVIVGTLWCATTRRTSLAMALLMVYLGAFDGYVKLRSGSNLATFVRDALLYGIVIGLLVRASVKGQRLTAPPLSAWAIGYAVVVLAQVANPHDGTLFHSLAGVRQDLEFVPLFFLTFAFVRTTKALRTFVVLLVTLAVANGVVDFVQFHLTPQQLAAWGPGYAQRVLGTGGFQFAGRVFYNAAGAVTRPFGLMSDAGAGGLVCALALGGILALTAIPGRRRYLVLAAVGAVAAVAGVITSQGRAVLVCSVIVVLAYALLTATSRRGVSSVLGAAAAAAAVFGVVTVLGSSNSHVFRYHGVSTTQILQTTSAARGRSLSRIPHTLATYPLGAGLGVAGPATGTSGAPPQAGTLDAENEISYATLESGIAGMAILVGLTLTVFFLGLRRCRYEPDREARVLIAAIIAPVAGILGLYAANAVTATTPCGPYLWAAAGIASYWLVVRPAERRRETEIPEARAIRRPERPRQAVASGASG